MKQILEKISKLIDLKSIVTLSLTCALIWGFVHSKIEAKDFLIYVAMVFSFYFSKKDTKEGDEVNGGKG